MVTAYEDRDTRPQMRHILIGRSKADADLNQALEFTSDSRTRMSILRTLGSNREMVVQDDDSALEVYRQITCERSYGRSISNEDKVWA